MGSALSSQSILSMVLYVNVFLLLYYMLQVPLVMMMLQVFLLFLLLVLLVELVKLVLFPTRKGTS